MNNNMNNLDIEKAVCGAVLMAGAHALNRVERRSFEDPACREVINACRRLDEHHLPIDPLTVTDEMGKVDSGSAWVTSMIIDACISACPTPDNIAMYVHMMDQRRLNTRQ